MSMVALLLVVVLSLASVGVAAWTWWALKSVGELEIDFGRFEARHFEIR
jgi:predicted negative regulator of RcsB-dependent stress response